MRLAFGARTCSATRTWLSACGRKAYSRRRCTSPTPISARSTPAPLRGLAVSRRVREDESDATAFVASTRVRVTGNGAWFVGLRPNQTVTDIVRPTFIQ